MTGTVGIFPLFFSFTRCISTPWIFAFAVFSAVSDLDTRLRNSLQSWESFSLLMSQTFSEEVWKWSSNFLNRFRVSCSFCSVQYLWGYLLLLPCLCVSHHSSSGPYLWGILTVPKFSLILGVFKFLGRTASRLRSNVPGSLIPDFCCSHLYTKMVFPICFHFLWHYFKFGRLSLFSARRRGKNWGNRRICQ